jgi:hypothetical protein
MGEGRYQFGSVLIVRVNHDHNVGAPLQGSGVARLLVPAIAAVLRVDDGVQAETSTTMTSSTMSGISAAVRSRVCSALYAGMTTMILFLSITEKPR